MNIIELARIMLLQRLRTSARKKRYSLWNAAGCMRYQVKEHVFKYGKMVFFAAWHQALSRYKQNHYQQLAQGSGRRDSYWRDLEVLGLLECDWGCCWMFYLVEEAGRATGRFLAKIDIRKIMESGSHLHFTPYQTHVWLVHKSNTRCGVGDGKEQAKTVHAVGVRHILWKGGLGRLLEVKMRKKSISLWCPARSCGAARIYSQIITKHPGLESLLDNSMPIRSKSRCGWRQADFHVKTLKKFKVLSHFWCVLRDRWIQNKEVSK